MKGLGVSPGIAIGRIYVDWKEQVEIEREYVDDVDIELERLNLALETAGMEIAQLYGYYDSQASDDAEAAADSGTIQNHGAMLQDPEFIGQVKDKIISEGVSAAWAMKTVSEKFVQVFEGMDSDYLKTKADDVKDIAARVCRLLLHVEEGDNLGKSPNDVIVVCRSLNSSDITLIQKEKIIAIVAEEGTKTSHGIIMARNCHKPAVVGIEHVTDLVCPGDLVIVDGSSGDVILNPDEATLEEYRRRQQEAREFAEHLRSYAGRTICSADGLPFSIYGNAASPNDVKSILDEDGRGVGLYRTEYLYLERDRLPSEGEQYWDYKRIVMAMKGRPVVFRTLDIGGDKIPEYLSIPEDSNPALGHRAIRYSLSRVDIFRVQLRALLRASAHGDVAIMLPLVTTLGELRAARAVLEDVKAELRRNGVPFGSVRLGVMVETPAAAVISDLLAQECDFMSIGSNDLVQYTMAVDRGDPSLMDLYSPFHPAVLRLIQQVIQSGKAAGTPVSLCGEMAGEPLMIPLLMGLGLQNFSVNPSSLLLTSWIIASLNQKDMEAEAARILAMKTGEEVLVYCQSHFGQFNRNI